MQKYKVYGTYEITIAKEVWANNKADAIKKAEDTFGGVIEYCGNGGFDKLLGVANDDESVMADGEAEWGVCVEHLADDPKYLECFGCGEKLDEVEDGVFYCLLCDKWFDEHGEEIPSNVIAKALSKASKERNNV